MIELFRSWRECASVPEEWEPAGPPGHRRKIAVNNSGLKKVLRAAKPGKWMKVYLKGKDGSEIHYFEHESGVVTLVKYKRK